ncbi:MAG: type II toxin-antitoxin system MqsR family toxin [Oceanicoccus sp.]|uniref:type II toxin-antitoxin system MqsR family toxin n=1 Tax=Oceanicoccus sp. TaxID=2691044 RepID=UPI002603E37E|nr:type II toxin-antitoxin system MqsR family toxin [Oceanicoccus sp.]MCP3907634.1 type II toxin-antitoxin system MqsR family toxin [Oceanicoccus sp.]MDG1773128.1 type II toxin-antitoxin system MqsR family toxin [Oceanicoccus sp.]
MSSTPSYDLNAIKRAFSDVSALRMTGSARRGAFELGFSDEKVVAAIQALTRADFYKSMSPKTAGFTAMQDVYKSRFRGVDLYIKFQLLPDGQLLLSFKAR